MELPPCTRLWLGGSLVITGYCLVCNLGKTALPACWDQQDMEKPVHAYVHSLMFLGLVIDLCMHTLALLGYTNTHAYTCMIAHTHTYTCARTCVHSLSLSLSLSLCHTHTHARTHARAYTHTHTHTHTYRGTLSIAHTCSHTHTHTHTHCTHTHFAAAFFVVLFCYCS